VIGDNRIELRAWREKDIDALGRLRNDLLLQEMLLSRPRPNSAERVQDWVTEKSNRNDSVFFVIAARSDDQVIGYVQVVNMNAMNGTGELGICIGPDVQGSGYGSVAMTLLEDYLKRIFGMRKLLLHVSADNERAVNFYIKLGFDEVGCMKQHFLRDGQYRDVLIMEKFLSN
jgi:RimJ/RimL family protein N-acetyltransferase